MTSNSTGTTALERKPVQRLNVELDIDSFGHNPLNTPNIKDLPAKAIVTDAKLWYGKKQALNGVSMNVPENRVLALIGPSGCGKSTFLRCFNRMNDLIEDVTIEGEFMIDGENIYAPNVDEVELRKRIGMVFQKPNPFPKSIYDNIAYAPLTHGLVSKGRDADNLVEQSLRRAGLWEEVRDRLDELGTSLSGGQQQRLCIARAIAVDPELILMDEPCSALDPISTEIVEELIRDLKDHYTIVIVTHNLQQALRVADYTAFFHMGNVIEIGETRQMFKYPQHAKTSDYLQGRFG